MSTSLIEVKKLKKYFKTYRGMLHAVDDISFKIKKSQTLGIVGESGCGKSTLGRTMVRLLDATDGEVFYNGEDILKSNKKRVKELRKELQIIFQDPYSSLNPRMTVSEIIAEPIKICKTIKDRKGQLKRVFEVMETVGLSERYINAYPHELDGGRRQRIGVARALVLEPKFIVCDEPVSALDVSIQAQILNLMMDLQDDFGLTYMFITHDLSVVKHIADDVLVMYLGQCVEKAPVRKLFNNTMHPYTKALLKSIPIPNLKYNSLENNISGEVSSPIEPELGCRFAPRCPFVQEECTKRDIPLIEIEPNHFVACTQYVNKA